MPIFSRAWSTVTVKPCSHVAASSITTAQPWTTSLRFPSRPRRARVYRTRAEVRYRPTCSAVHETFGFSRDIYSTENSVYTQKRSVPKEVQELRELLEVVGDFSSTSVFNVTDLDMNKLQLREYGVPDGPQLVAFEKDVAMLVKDFAVLTGLEKVAVQVTLTRGTMCSKLHVDNVGLRLLRTYFGPGTEWVASPALSRVLSESLRFGGNSITDALKALVSTISPIERAEQGEVVLLKGQAFPGAMGRAIVHRSPLLSSSEQGQLRLLVKIDDFME
eukprot:CAMPEP_0114240872 /NCGR_PEP_ID=MMETSP0058-20121206/9335_1 /TAXON_ID=36894 /ORGANISM="Pyramimonas parkeae, CCMP726" /LENGTH=274 /DNA_ID=CAMNT_0001353369 /DNA_START=109 /DNA_END=933 /DNA_ORIENTATION=+